MGAPIPTREPERFHAGDTLVFTRAIPLYPPSAGFVLSYAFISEDGTKNFNIAATTQALVDAFQVTVAPVTTITYAAGRYIGQGVVTGTDGSVYTVYDGAVTISPSLSQMAGTDLRSHVKRVYDAVCLAIEGRAGASVLASIVDGVQLSRIPHADLLKLRDRYLVFLRGEEQTARWLSGKRGDPRVRVTRFRCGCGEYSDGFHNRFGLPE